MPNRSRRSWALLKQHYLRSRRSIDRKSRTTLHSEAPSRRCVMPPAWIRSGRTKGFWSGLGLGDFYYELGVKVVGVCAATREENGGLIALDDFLDRLDDDQVSR